MNTINCTYLYEKLHYKRFCRKYAHIPNIQVDVKSSTLIRNTTKGKGKLNLEEFKELVDGWVKQINESETSTILITDWEYNEKEDMFGFRVELRNYRCLLRHITYIEYDAKQHLISCKLDGKTQKPKKVKPLERNMAERGLLVELAGMYYMHEIGVVKMNRIIFSKK